MMNQSCFTPRLAACHATKTFRKCKDLLYPQIALPRQRFPWFVKPQSMSEQWWQNVGLWKVFFSKAWPCSSSIVKDIFALSSLLISLQPDGLSQTKHSSYFAILWCRKYMFSSLLYPVGNIKTKFSICHSTLPWHTETWRRRPPKSS